MGYFLLFINVIGLLEAQNFRYVPEDWYIITKPGAITAIAEDNFNLYFATENGVYRYDKAMEDFQYDYSFSVQLQFPNITHFYFDSYRDYFWVVHGQGISFKSSVSTIWRDMSLINSGIFSIYEIDDIGSSPEYFWIRSGDDVFPFDPFSGLPADWEDARNEVDIINWGHSSSGIAGENLDLFWYSIEGDWDIGLGQILPNGKRGHVISNKNGKKLMATMQMEDSNGNLWIGTNGGYVLKGWTQSSRLNMISFGLLSDNVTITYFDSEENWWFADSKFKRTGQFSSFNSLYQSSPTPFISQWNEPTNQWTYYYPDESIVIENTDVNSILRIGSTMYFGTMSGLLYLDLYNRDWNIITATNGLNDSAVWDMVEHDGSIYVATSNGINEVSIINHKVIPDRDNRFEKLTQFNIYDMEADSQNIYLASDAGLFQLSWEGTEIKTLSKRDLRKIRLEDGKIMGTDGMLWSIYGYDDEEYILSNVQNFDMCGSFLWSSSGNQVTLTDTITARSWDYGMEDGIPGNKIYGVNCDESWVWFLTNKGVAFYNWSRYH
jgi:hypothetical protein